MRRKASELEKGFVPIPDYVPPRFIATEVKPDVKVLDILVRICDACHGMDSFTEPWASIRKDIEKLR